MNAISFSGCKGSGRVFGTAVLALTLLISGCAGNRYERSTGETIDDNATTFRVKNALSDDPVFKYPDVTVTTFKGTVQLGGFVNTAAQKSRAEDVARHVEGVKQVTDAIALK
jgi:hyperosmotically inducible protein